MKTSTSPPSKRVGITLDPDERAVLDAAAARRFVQPSTMARMLVLAGLRQDATAPKPEPIA